MVLAVIQLDVGEFHDLHHGPGGTPYADPNEMGVALLTAAAAEAGLRITLLSTLYLAATVDGAPLAGPQLRFSDGTVDAWATRVDALEASPDRPHRRRPPLRSGAVPAAALAAVGDMLEGAPPPG